MVVIVKNGKIETIDVELENYDSIDLFWLLSDKARSWIKGNVHVEDWQRFGNALAVEHRMAGDLTQGMLNSGLIVKTSEPGT